MKLKIKLFADGANLKEMLDVYNTKTVQGFTTNPTLMKKAGITNYKEFAKSVTKAISDLPISFEVFSDDFREMEREARVISSWGDNVYVKIPITDSFGNTSIPLIYKLSNDDIKLNITAILTSEQVHAVCSCLNEDTPSIISVFAGRIADTGRNPVETMYNCVPIIRSSLPNAELLWASTRELYNILQAQKVGCHIVTVPNDILKKLPMLEKDLTELSLDTVKQFRQDALSSGYKI